MNLAINYSPAVCKLVRTEGIQVDYFKTPDWDWMINEATHIRPVAVHFTLDAGNNQLSQVDWGHIRGLLHSTGTPFINLHLDPRQSSYPDLSVDSNNPYVVERLYQIMYTDVKAVVQRFGAERVIVENSPYRGETGKTMRACVEPEIITRIVQETGVGFLLDLSHAIISARYLDIEPSKYIESLPVHRIKEMHFAGIHRSNGYWTDHLSILKADWQWLDWAIECIRLGHWSSPWLLAFEYGGVGKPFKHRTNPNVMAKQVPQLYERVKLIVH